MYPWHRWRLVFLLGLGLELSPSSLQAAGGPDLAESPAFAIHGGGSKPGRWAGGVQVGFPWQALHIQYGLTGGWTPFVEVGSALFQRTEPSIGVALRWVDRPRLRVAGEALLGWQVQTGVLAQNGPSLALRVRAAWVGHRVMPYTAWTTRHTLLVDHTVLETASGPVSTFSSDLHWDALGVVGVAVAVSPRIGLELGFEYPRIDGSAVTIPGFHLGLQFGGMP